MTCPTCSSPMLFGATTCACGYTPSTSNEADNTIDLSYFEALRAYWRVYWPTQLFIALGIAIAGGTLFDTLVQVMLSAVGFLLFVARITARPYKGFSIVVSSNDDAEIRQRLTFRQRLEVWAFLWWRQFLAMALAAVLSAPLLSILGTMNANPQIGTWIVIGAGVLVVGPILLKMLIGHTFKSFQLLALRKAA